MEQTTASKLHSEVDNVDSQFCHINRLSASLVIAVSLHVHHPVEVGINEINSNQDAVSQAVNLEVGSREVCP